MTCKSGLWALLLFIELINSTISLTNSTKYTYSFKILNLNDFYKKIMNYYKDSLKNTFSDVTLETTSYLVIIRLKYLSIIVKVTWIYTNLG